MKGISFLLLALTGCAALESHPDVVRDPLNANYEEYRICYKRSPMYETKTKGTLTVEFRIDQVGNVTEVDLIKSDFTDQAFHNCIIKSIGETKFSPSKYPGGTHVTQPYVFGP
jgi:TonB family protein